MQADVVARSLCLSFARSLCSQRRCVRVSVCGSLEVFLLNCGRLCLGELVPQTVATVVVVAAVAVHSLE